MKDKFKNPLGRGKKTFLIASALIAVIAVAYFSFISPPPEAEDVRGTIGGVEKAEKYRAEQITDKDVILQDPEIQELLQNDMIHNLLTSKAGFEGLQALMSNKAGFEGLHALVSNKAGFEGLQALVSNKAGFDGLQALMSNKEFEGMQALIGAE